MTTEEDPEVGIVGEKDKGPLLIGLTIMFEVIAVIFLGLRLYSRYLRKQNLMSHDYLNFIGFGFSIALATCAILIVQKGGFGQTPEALSRSPWKQVEFGKLLFAVQPLWALAVTSIRLSILMLYIHIFSQIRWFRIACQGLMVITILWALGDIAIVLLLCRPIEFNWNVTIPGGRCIPAVIPYLTIHSVHLAINTSIALLPIPVLWRLRIPTLTKMGIMVMFIFGAVICSASVAGLATYEFLPTFNRFYYNSSGSMFYIYRVMEPPITCALTCIPMIRPVVDKVMLVIFPLDPSEKLVADDTEEGGNAESSGRPNTKEPPRGRAPAMDETAASLQFHKWELEIGEVAPRKKIKRATVRDSSIGRRVGPFELEA